MLLIQDILVSTEAVKEKFLCQLDACKGACCWEGEYGAPLEAEELETLQRIYPLLKPLLTEEGISAIEEQGLYTYYDELPGFGTTLLPGGACVYLTFDQAGIAQCGIEKAWEAGLTSFQKPISCHLYPLRVSKNEEIGFEALNYDRWDICAAACSAGKKAKLPVFRFVKNALIRKYGQEWFEELEAAAAFLK